MKFTEIFILCVSLTIVHGYGSLFSSEVSKRNDSTKENWISRLYGDKMDGYNKMARPVKDPSHNTTVFLGLYLTNINMDDKKQEMMVSAWSIMTWTDEHLSWEPKNYMNIDRIHFDQTDIWTPDIAVYNSANAAGVIPFVKVPVLADHLGRTYWFPPTHITVNCDLDISEWPSDQHECLVRMGSWSHHGEQIDIQIIKHNDTTDVMMSNYEKNNQWDLLNVKATREVINLEGHESYVEINFAFTVKRMAKVHGTHVTTSALVVMIVVLLTYALPLSNFFSRLIMHLFALGILITCYLTLFTSLPANGGPVPFVVRYYSGTTVLTLISLVSTIFLTTQTCCHSSPSSDFGKRIAGMMASAPGLRVGSPSQQPYNQLGLDTLDDAENPTTETETASTRDTKIFTAYQIRRVVNFLLLVLFAIAFFVDYAVLRSVTK